MTSEREDSAVIKDRKRRASVRRDASAGKNRTVHRVHGLQKRVTSTEGGGGILCPFNVL